MTNSIGRPALLLLLFAAGVLGIQAASAAPAQADPCYGTQGEKWDCRWEANQQPYTERYFTAPNGNNDRRWYHAWAWDAYSGTVAAKCVALKKSSNGEKANVACGSGYPGNPIGDPWKPAYVYSWHSANGARTIGGAAYHPFYT